MEQLSTLDVQSKIIDLLLQIPIQQWTYFPGCKGVPGIEEIYPRYMTMLGSYDACLRLIPESPMLQFGNCVFNEPSEKIEKLIEFVRNISVFNKPTHAVKLTDVYQDIVNNFSAIEANNKRYRIVEILLAIPNEKWNRSVVKNAEVIYEVEYKGKLVNIIHRLPHESGFSQYYILIEQKEILDEPGNKIYNKFIELEKFDMKKHLDERDKWVEKMYDEIQ